MPSNSAQTDFNVESSSFEEESCLASFSLLADKSSDNLYRQRENAHNLKRKLQNLLAESVVRREK